MSDDAANQCAGVPRRWQTARQDGRSLPDEDEQSDQRRQKRGGGMVRGESILAGMNGGSQFGLAELAVAEEEPGFGDALSAECERLLNLLEDESLRSLALLKMEGYTNEEIAEKLGCARRTVQRRLKLIQEIWGAEASDSE